MAESETNGQRDKEPKKLSGKVPQLRRGKKMGQVNKRRGSVGKKRGD